jgi:hypothetical protein
LSVFSGAEGALVPALSSSMRSLMCPLRADHATLIVYSNNVCFLYERNEGYFSSRKELVGETSNVEVYLCLFF